MRQQHRVWRGSGRAALVIAGLLLGTVGLWQAAPGAQGVQGTSTLTGRVTADKGEVRALRVQARDAGRGIVYTVFTTEGQYRILNLRAGTYEVQVVEGTFDSPVQRMTLAVGQTGTVNLAIAQKADAGSQYTQIVNSRSASLGAVNATAELVEFDELYPPGPGRDLLIAECTGCHGPGWHQLEGRTAEQWAKGLEKKPAIQIFPGSEAGKTSWVPRRSPRAFASSGSAMGGSSYWMKIARDSASSSRTIGSNRKSFVGL